MCLETGSGVSVARVRSPLQYRFNILNGDREGGTTTFARKFLPKYANRTNFVNADLTAAGVSPFSPESAVVRAGG